mgnify:CR=1 FL=1
MPGKLLIFSPVQNHKKEKAKEEETGEQEETEEYFTTSIVDGEIVTQRMYMLSLIHI